MLLGSNRGQLLKDFMNEMNARLGDDVVVKA